MHKWNFCAPSLREGAYLHSHSEADMNEPIAVLGKNQFQR